MHSPTTNPIQPTKFMSSRYGNYDSNVSTGGDNDYDDIILKLTAYTVINADIDRINAFNSSYGDKFLVGLENVEVLDGIVFQRKDKPDTYKLISFGELFDVDTDTGAVLDPDTGEELTADEVMNHGKVQYFDEKFGGTTYEYDVVGVAIEANNDEPIEVGEATMMLSNKGWVRKLAKILSAQGHDIIEMTENENGREVPVSEGYGWLTTLEPTLRDGFEGRNVDLWVEQDSFTPDGEDEEVNFTAPIVVDTKSGEQVGIENGSNDGGGSTTGNASSGSTSGSVGDDSGSDDTSDDTASAAGETEFSNEVEELIDYFVRTDEDDYDTMETMLGQQTDGSVDVDAVVAEVEARQVA